MLPIIFCPAGAAAFSGRHADSFQVQAGFLAHMTATPTQFDQTEQEMFRRRSCGLNRSASLASQREHLLRARVNCGASSLHTLKICLY